MNPENSHQFIGRLAAAPDPLGPTGIKFRLGVDRYDRQAKAKVTIWVNFVAWGKAAERFSQYARVGQQIAVSCEYAPREYDYQGQKRLDPQFIVDDFKLLAESNRQQQGFSGPATSDFDNTPRPPNGYGF